MVDGAGSEPQRNMAILIEDGTIREIRPHDAAPIPPDAEIIDGSSFTVMPGLIESHIHLIKANIRYFQNYQLATVITHPTLMQMYALRSAQIMLEAGFTTIKNQPHFMPWEPRSELYGVAVRDSIAVGLFQGPRMVTGGYAHITNSHFDYTTPRSLPRFDDVTADGPWALRRMVRQILRGGADFIKTCLSGGGGTSEEAENIRNMTQEEIDAIADEAHAFGKMCSAHCFTALSQKMAMRADIDVLEHCVFTDDEAIAMMVDRNQLLVPTLAHRSDKAIEQRREHGAPQNVLDKMKRIQEDCWKSFQRIHEAGVPLAMGTDTQIDPEVGDSADELEIYVQLGMSPHEAIITATSTAARAVGLSDKIGTLQTGKLADLILVAGDPLRDIHVLSNHDNIRVVMKGGDVAIDRLGIVDRNPVLAPRFVGGEY